MKKFLLLSLSIGSALLGLGQLTPPPATTSTTTGQVPGGNIATCNYAPGTPNSCIHICRNSVTISGTANSLTPRTIHFEYYQVTNGNKGMHVQVFCGQTLLVNDCLDASADPQNTLMYKDYTTDQNGNPIVCQFKTNITIKIQAHTGNNCGGSACGPELISTGGSPLPVSFKSFSAARNHSSVSLKWETASEINNSGFAIERLTNGTWQQVGWVPSQAAGGNSDAVLTYSYADANSVKGVSQYRVRQVDIDGKATYSDIRSVRGEGQTGKTIVYPNPSNDGKVNVVFEDGTASRDLSVVDINGRTVKQYRAINNNNITIENLQPGLYTLRITIPETGEQAVEKIIVNKR